MLRRLWTRTVVRVVVWLVGVMRDFCANEPLSLAFCRPPHPDSWYVSFDVYSAWGWPTRSKHVALTYIPLYKKQNLCYWLMYCIYLYVITLGDGKLQICFRGQLKRDWHTRRNPISSFAQNGPSPFKSARWAGRQFSRLLADEVCASAVVMLDTPCSEVVWRVLATHCIRQFPPSHPRPCVIVCHPTSTGQLKCDGTRAQTRFRLWSETDGSI